MVAGGYPADRIHNLGETSNPRLTEILDTIADLVEGEQGVLVGMVNIHTDQAEMLIEHFEELRGGAHDAELEASRAPERLPMGSQRIRWAGARARRAARPGAQVAQHHLGQARA
jgi:gamma-polyglutamate synthase